MWGTPSAGMLILLCRFFTLACWAAEPVIPGLGRLVDGARPSLLASAGFGFLSGRLLVFCVGFGRRTGTLCVSTSA